MPQHQLTTSLSDIFFTAFSLLCLSLPTSHRFLRFPTRRLKLLSSTTLRRISLSIPTRRRTLPMSSPSRHHFATPQALSDWLKPRLPSKAFTLWGTQPGTKNVHNLWLELAEGETSLSNSTPPVRTVNVLTLRIIGRDNSVLIESGQELSDGSFRSRNRPLSEKMRPGESPEDAAYRAVREELGSVIGDGGVVRVLEGSYRRIVEEKDSMSYPGLPGCYVLHCLDAVVEGLPEEGEFWTEEGEEYSEGEGNRVADQAVSTKRHCWKWVSANSI